MVYGINILRIEYCQKTTPLRWIVGEEERKGKERKGKEKERKKEKGKKEKKIKFKDEVGVA